MVSVDLCARRVFGPCRAHIAVATKMATHVGVGSSQREICDCFAYFGPSELARSWIFNTFFQLNQVQFQPF
jgi:hypothetical protein